MDVHVVREGDTLFKIATHSGRTVDELARCNRISNPNRIEVGQILRIPPKTATAQYPMDNKTTKYFGFGDIYPKQNRFAGKPHPGIDFHVEERAPVYAVAPGVVRKSSYDGDGYGYYNLIEHRLVGNIPIFSLNAHLILSILTGYVVNDQTQVGLEGATGMGSMGVPHLHFELKWTDDLGLYNLLDVTNLDNFYANPVEVFENEEFKFLHPWCWNCPGCND